MPPKKLNKPATKQDVSTLKLDMRQLNNKLTKDMDGLQAQINFIDDKFERRFDQMDDKLTEFRDQVMTGLDRVMGELKTIREEQILSGGLLSDHSDQLEDYEKRIGPLEGVMPA